MGNRCKILLITGFFLHVFLTANICRAATLDEKSQNAVHALYHFRFHEADSLITELEKQYPNHYLPFVARSQFYWWKLISQPFNDKLQLRYIQSLLHAENRITQKIMNEDTGYHELFYLINIYASRARLDLMGQEYVKAIRHLARSAGYIRLSLENEDDFIPFMLTSGLYNYMAGHGEEEYPFFRIYTFRYPRGNKIKGLEQLINAASGNNALVKTEAHYFLMKIYSEIEGDYQEALPFARWLADTYPDNLIFVYHYHEIVNHLNRENASEQIKKNYFQSLEGNHQLDSRQVTHFRELL